LQQQNQAKLIAKTGKTYWENKTWAELTAKSSKYWHLPKILTYTQNIRL
jgi:hypothetical protein